VCYITVSCKGLQVQLRLCLTKKSVNGDHSHQSTYSLCLDKLSTTSTELATLSSLVNCNTHAYWVNSSVTKKMKCDIFKTLHFLCNYQILTTKLACYITVCWKGLQVQLKLYLTNQSVNGDHSHWRTYSLCLYKSSTTSTELATLSSLVQCNTLAYWANLLVTKKTRCDIFAALHFLCN
jgi:hypothetical protein